MNIYVIIIVIGFAFQIAGAVGYLKSTQLHTETETVQIERQIFDNQTGKLINYENGGVFDSNTWKLVKRNGQ